MTAYYNEFDRHAAAWLRELIKEGHIAPGDVDERPIQEVMPDDLAQYTQVHLFAGIGGWSYALRLAGWPDDRPVWTGSCPCQPFSAAGKQRGGSDTRHLWPEMFRLIRECSPPVVFGEQVASAIGHGWLDRVFADLEGEGYACGSAVLGAHSVGAPHIRQRLWWVADAGSVGRQMPHIECADGPSEIGDGETSISRSDRMSRGLSISKSEGRPRVVAEREDSIGERSRTGGDCTVGGLRDTDLARLEGRGLLALECAGERTARAASVWDRFDIIPFRDGKSRRIEPGLSPLVDGLPGRVGLLRGYGNAIVPQVAAEFIAAYCEARAEGGRE